MSSLSFRWRAVNVPRFPYVEAPTPSPFLDFEVDGVSLYDAIRDRGYEYIGWLGVYGADYERQAIGRLLLQEPPDPWVHNPELYVCPLCYDLGCGAITVKVERSDGCFTWCELIYDQEPCYDTLEGLGPYRFAEGVYAEALTYATALTKSGI